jgi:hypothetical protein
MRQIADWLEKLDLSQYAERFVAIAKSPRLVSEWGELWWNLIRFLATP